LNTLSLPKAPAKVCEASLGSLWSTAHTAAENERTVRQLGNVRKLFDLVKQNIFHSPDNVMTEECVRQSLGSDSIRIASYDDARDEFSRGYLVMNLRSTAGNITQSTRLAKRYRTDFHKPMLRYRILAEDFKRRSSR